MWKNRLQRVEDNNPKEILEDSFWDLFEHTRQERQIYGDYIISKHCRLFKGSKNGQPLPQLRKEAIKIMADLQIEQCRQRGKNSRGLEKKIPVSIQSMHSIKIRKSIQIHGRYLELNNYKTQ